MKFDVFRNIVLSNANGRYIHYINSACGVLRNSISNGIYWKDKDESKYLENTNRAKESYKSLSKVSKIPCLLEELEI